jgi:hypothetical protein
MAVLQIKGRSAGGRQLRQTVAQQKVKVITQSQNVTMDLTKHASGVYHVRVISEEV